MPPIADETGCKTYSVANKLFLCCAPGREKYLCFLPSKTVQIILFFLSFPFAAAAQALVICSVSFTYLSFSFYKIKLSFKKFIYSISAYICFVSKHSALFTSKPSSTNMSLHVFS